MYTVKTFALVSSAVGLVMLAGVASAGTIDPHFPPPISGEFELGPTSPGKWGDPTPGTGASVTYSFMPSGLRVDGGKTSVALSEFMPTGYKAEIVAAFDAWQNVANITFSEVSDPGVDWWAAGATASDIRISGHIFDSSRVLAHGYYPPNNGGGPAGDIHFNSGRRWKIGFAGAGFDIFQVAAHEIGHAIGLGHECGDNGRETPCETALMNPVYTQSFRGLRADDVAGAQHLYGTAIAPVPLPAGLPLLGGALILLGGLWRRRASSRIR